MPVFLDWREPASAAFLFNVVYQPICPTIVSPLIIPDTISILAAVLLRADILFLNYSIVKRFVVDLFLTPSFRRLYPPT